MNLFELLKTKPIVEEKRESILVILARQERKRLDQEKRELEELEKAELLLVSSLQYGIPNGRVRVGQNPRTS